MSGARLTREPITEDDIVQIINTRIHSRECAREILALFAQRDAAREGEIERLRREVDEQSAKHADCCVDRQERDELSAVLRAREQEVEQYERRMLHYHDECARLRNEIAPLRALVEQQQAALQWIANRASDPSPRGPEHQLDEIVTKVNATLALPLPGERREQG